MVAIGLSLSAAAERAADRGGPGQRGAARALSFLEDERPAPKIKPRLGVSGAKSGQLWSPMRHEDQRSMVPTIRYDSQANLCRWRLAN
jgi:hypothetical protein